MPHTLPPARDLTSQTLAKLGEGLVACWADASGFQLLAKGLRHIGFELDIVVRRGSTLCVLEVKTRLNPKHPPDMNTTRTWIGARKKAALTRGLNHILGKLSANDTVIKTLTVDLIAVDLFSNDQKIKAYRWPNVLSS
jgi:Holliday junction resolvase-like predicted endonuclease